MDVAVDDRQLLPLRAFLGYRRRRDHATER
jgi:hypothetical protein